MSATSMATPRTSDLGSPQQTRRGTTSVSSGRGERLLDLVVGGALVIAGLRRRSLLGDALMLGGGWLFSAGVTGRFRPYAAMGLIRADQDSSRGLVVERAITIGRPREAVFTYWRDFSHLPTVMRNLVSVTPESGDGRHSHWIAAAPMGLKVEWDAEIVEERANELLA